MARVVVVGAGVGGLAAAVRLAALGHRVTVLEQAERVGGKLGLLEQDGFRFDTGPSLLTMPFALEETFAASGRDGLLADHLELVRVEPICRYRFPDGSGFDASADGPTMTAALEAFSPGSAAEWGRFIGRASRIWAPARATFLEVPLVSPTDLVRRSTGPLDGIDVAAHTTLRRLARRHLTDPRLRWVAERYATYSGSDPARAPGTAAVIPYVEAVLGAWHVRGGMHRIATALAARASDLGVEIHLGADVTRIGVAGGRVRGVELAGGGRVSAEVVVANADAHHLYTRLLPSRRQARRLTRAPASFSGFALMLGMRGRTPALPHHSIDFPHRYQSEFDDLFRDPRPVRDPTVYLCNPAASDPSCAPEGDESWFCLVNAPRHGEVDWRAAAPAYAERLLDRLETLHGPVRSRIATLAWRSPADLEGLTRAPGGAIYGTSANGPRAAFLRPRNRSPVARGLYLVGGTAHPGGGLPLVMMSAKIVAGLIGPA